jgi:predicted chitinase
MILAGRCTSPVQRQRADRLPARAIASTGAVFKKCEIITARLVANLVAQNCHECGGGSTMVENVQLFCATYVSVRCLRPAPKARAEAGQEPAHWRRDCDDAIRHLTSAAPTIIFPHAE